MFQNRPRPSRTAVWLLACSAVAFSTWTALAAKGNSDRAIAEQVLTAHAPMGSTGGSPATRPLQEAKRALDRADRARASGDAVNADYLEGLAREWAELARDATTASSTERQAATAQSAAAETATKVKRVRALLEEQMAQRARAQGELKKLQDSPTSVDGASIRAMRTAPRSSSTLAAPPGSTKPAPAAAPTGGEP